MALTLAERKAVVRELAVKYTKASKKERGRLIDGLIDLTSYNRSYAARVLRACHRQISSVKKTGHRKKTYS